MFPQANQPGEGQNMGQFSVEIPASNGSILNGIQHFRIVLRVALVASVVTTSAAVVA